MLAIRILEGIRPSQTSNIRDCACIAHLWNCDKALRLFTHPEEAGGVNCPSNFIDKTLKIRVSPKFDLLIYVVEEWMA